MSTAAQPVTSFDPDAFMATRQKQFDPDEFMAQRKGAPNIASESEMAAHPPTPKPLEMKPSYLGLALSNSPTGADPHNPGNPNLNAIPESEREKVNDRALGTQLSVLPLDIAGANPSLIRPTLRALARGYLGAKVGEYAGRDIGGMVGHPEAGSRIGGVAGGLFGGLGGNVINPKVALLKSMFSEAPEAEAAAEATYPGAPLPTAEGFYENRSAEINAMRKLQPGAFAEPAAAAPEPEPLFPGAPLPAYEDYAANRGAEINAIRRMQPQAPPRLSTTEGATYADVPAAPKGVSAPFTPPAETPTAEPIGSPIKLPETPKTSLEDVINQATGVKPLRSSVPLREQLTKMTPPAEPVVHHNPMEVANGKEIYDLAKDNPATMKAIHDLTRVDLRQALINAGEDMGQVTVSNSKFAGVGSITRQDAFARLLQKGYSPEEIVKLAKSVPVGESIGTPIIAPTSGLGRGLFGQSTSRPTNWSAVK